MTVCACAVACGILSTPAPTRASDGTPTPVTTYLDGIAAAAQALADGDAHGAEAAARAALTAAPAGEAPGRALLALGLAMRGAGRFPEAASTLGTAVEILHDPALLPVARFERGQALFYAGDPADAAALFAELARSGPPALARRARWREADALLEAGRAPAAVAAYEAAIAAEGGVPAPGARLALASALRAAGEDGRAVDMYRALWIDQPADPAGRAAARILRSWRAAGGPVPPPTPDQRLARAARFLDVAKPRRALRVLDRLGATAPPPEPASRAMLLRAFALLQVGRLEEAAGLARAIEASPAAQPGTRTGAVLVLARVAARSGRVDAAAARYRTVAASRDPVPGLPPARARELPQEARYLSAWLYFEAGRYARAADLLRAYARANPEAPRALDARWFEAWSLLRLGRRDAARRAMQRLAHGPLATQATYWLARLEPDPGRRREALQRVLREAPPGSWYGLLAAGRLRLMGAPLAIDLDGGAATPIADGTAAAEPADPLARAAALLGAGLRAEALADLRTTAAGRPVHGRAAELAQLAEAAGDAELPFRMARDHLPPSRRALRWLYPRAHPDLVEPSARAAGCDAELYLAVMRRESAFRPDARSGAGAIGLVQLIPPTAERLAEVYGVSATAVRDLESPAVSVPLGAAYLALLAERFRDPAVVLAAYNAGPPAAGRWAAARAGLPLDEWVESIPFRETRRYVRNVSADAIVYAALWRSGPAWIDGDRKIPAPRPGVVF